MGRLSALDAGALTAEQRAIYQDILKTRKGNIAGPFAPWLHSPVLADRAQKLGAFCRFESTLAPRLSELAILVTAKQWRANVEWLIHAPIAAAEGLSVAVIDALQAGRRPSFEHQDEALVYELSVELYASKRVRDSTYDKAVELLGETGVVDLVGILGYYALVAMTLNVFEVDLPENSVAPFAES
jgi:4-carboxymuconolactone decarboxylase